MQWNFIIIGFVFTMIWSLKDVTNYMIFALEYEGKWTNLRYAAAWCFSKPWNLYKTRQGIPLLLTWVGIGSLEHIRVDRGFLKNHYV